MVNMQEGTLYRHILRDAWQITLKNRVFWVLGALTVFWGGIGAFTSIESVIGKAGSAVAMPFEGGRLPSLQDFTPGGIAALVAAGLIVLATSGVLLALATSARGGLILAIGRRQEGKKVRLASALQKGMRAFFPLLIISILSRLDILFALLALHPLAAAAASPQVLVLYILAFVAVTVTSLILSVIAVYAMAYVMLEDMPLVHAVREGVALFAEHWLISIEFGLILYGLNLLVGIAVIAALIAIGIPFALLGIIFSFLKVPGGFWFIATPLISLYVVCILFAGSAFATFQYATWTLLYMRVREGGAVAKVIRMTARFGHIFHRKLI